MGGRIEDFGPELKRMLMLIERRDDGVLAFSMYSEARIPKEAVEWLCGHSTVPVSPIRVTPESPDPRTAIRQFPPAPRRCFLFQDVEAGFPKLLGYVNLNREALLESGHALVFWVREEGLRRIAAEAPDFWAWRSRVFDFRTAQPDSIGPTGPHDEALGHFEKESIERQVSSLEQPGADFASQLALGRRYLALRNYPEADRALALAIKEAERGPDLSGLTEACFLLGNSKLGQGRLHEAEHLYRRSWEIAVGIGLKPRIIAALRQLSLLEQTRGNIDGAYDFVRQMIAVAETAKDITSLAGAYDQLGNVLFLKKDLRGAEQSYRNAMKYEEQLGHRSDLAFTLARLAGVYEQMGRLSEAEQALRRAANIFREVGEKSEEDQVLLNLERMRVEYT